MIFGAIRFQSDAGPDKMDPESLEIGGIVEGICPAH